MLFGIPSSLTDRCGLLLNQGICHQGNQRKQSKQGRRSPGNCQVIPLTLSFYPDVRSSLFKGHFQSPATDEPGQNLPRRVGQFCREQSLRLKLSQRITDQHPPNGDARVVRAAPPQRRLGADFHRPFALAIPVFNFQFRPESLGITQHLLEGRTPITFDSWPTFLTGLRRRRWIKQCGIQPQPRNQTDCRQLAHQLQQLDRRKAAVSDKNQRSIGQPASNQLNE